MPRNTSGLRRGGGRKKGVPNKATIQVREWSQSVLEDAEGRQKTLELYRKGRLAPAIVIELFNRAYGKTKDVLDLNLGELPPLTIRIEDARRD